jgi:preprotein translocase subunit SecD
MLYFSKWKLFSIVIICVVAMIVAAPNFLSDKFLYPWLPSQKLSLGLDLRGGSHLLLEMDFPSYIAEQYEITKDNFKKTLRQKKVNFQNLKVRDNKLFITAINQDGLKKIKTILKKEFEFLEIQEEGNDILLSFKEDFLITKKQKLVEQSIEIIRRRVDETGTREPIIQKQGDRNILLQVPGLYEPERLKNMLGQTAKLSFHLTEDGFAPESKILPPGYIKLPLEDVKSMQKPFIVLQKNPILTGDSLNDATTSYDDQNNPAVAFEFNNVGAKKFAGITTENAGKVLAIVLDNKIISAPVINEPITSGRGIIRGNFTIETANNLAVLLRAGALPTPLKIIEERTVGPSLGSDSIEAGKKAIIIGALAVMGFMLLIYGLFGLFANIALVVNVVVIVASLTMLQATLTLPGMAGIVLTMGMAVDANVLIFERIREEIRAGNAKHVAVDRGFKNAFATIMDSNLTTIFAAVLLYIFGSGAVKGFAVTLIIGISSSMFSSILITKYLMIKWLQVTKHKKAII